MIYVARGVVEQFALFGTHQPPRMAVEKGHPKVVLQRRDLP